MARTKALFIFATFVTSGIAVLLSFVTLGTQHWVVATIDLNFATISTTNNQVNYGLFSGSYTRRVSSTLTYDLKITCDFGLNKCAVLCGDGDVRSRYLQYLFQSTSIDGYNACDSAARSQTKHSVDNDVEKSLRDDEDVADVLDDEDSIPGGFINCGLWLSTILFLAISCAFGVITTLLAIWNTVANPVESVVSIPGLFIYNCCACASMLIVVLLWGIQFAVTLKDNVAIYDTISTSGNNENASLGYSYWLNVIVLLLYGTSIGVLALREYLINKEPDNVVNLEDKNDTTIILF